MEYLSDVNSQPTQPEAKDARELDTQLDAFFALGFSASSKEHNIDSAEYAALGAEFSRQKIAIYARLASARADCISERERGDLAIRQRDEARLASARAQIVEECRAATLGMTKPECLIAKDAALDKVKGLASAREQGDEYHTLDELYAHRFALTRALVTLMPDQCVKSKRNGDGSVWDGLFVVYINTPAGQVSYHYKIELWDQMPCREVEIPLAYDGHTPESTITRLASITVAERKGEEMRAAARRLIDRYLCNPDSPSEFVAYRSGPGVIAEWHALRAALATTAEGPSCATCAHGEGPIHECNIEDKERLCSDHGFPYYERKPAEGTTREGEK